MNELAAQLKIDPLQAAHSQRTEDRRVSWTCRSRRGTWSSVSKLGAEKFGWSKRTPEVGSMKRDGLTLGWGMAGCSWLAGRVSAPRSSCNCATTARFASRAPLRTSAPAPTPISRSLASDKTRHPAQPTSRSPWATHPFLSGPVSGGSLATESVIPAVFQAADSAIKSLLTVATTTPGSPFANRKPDELVLEGGKVFVKGEDPDQGVPFADVLRLRKVGARRR